MANEKVSQLPAVPSCQLTDVIYDIQGGISSQATLAQVVALTSASSNLSFAGNPNGNVAGNVYQTCWDTTDLILWVCTTTGSVSTAIWTPVIGTMTNGQLIIGSTGNAPVRATLTAGTNITITNTPGAIQISASGAGGFSWNNVTGTSATMISDNGYICTGGSLATLALPATSAFGDELSILAYGAGGWKISQGAGQQIKVGASISTLGATGFIASTSTGDAINLVCVVANTIWMNNAAPEGNLTIN